MQEILVLTDLQIRAGSQAISQLDPMARGLRSKPGVIVLGEDVTWPDDARSVRER